ncbi:hypothetical protein E2P81_ATG02583 [Venturia nashicola]|nr:hypothetical protein E2P81_ATG02583 [Venturia nashicola]
MSESSAEESLPESPALTVPLAPSAPATHPSREPTQGEGDTDTNAKSQANKKKRKAPQPADDTEHLEIPTSKRQKKNQSEEEQTEPEKSKKKDKKVRIAEPDDEEGLEGAEGQRGADPPNAQAIDAADNNARYGIISEERLSTLDLDTEENVPFTDTELTRARQGHERQVVECFLRQLTGPAAEINQIAEMRLEYIRPYTVTNELWAVWPELSLTMRLNLIEGLVEIEISNATRKLRKEAVRLRQELERAQVIMRDPRRWERGDDESEEKRARGPKQTSATQSKKKAEMPKDPDTDAWTSEDDERMRDLLERKEKDSPDAVEKYKEDFDERPEWRADERRFCLEFTKARNNLRLEGDGQWKIGSDAMRELSRAHRERFANTHPGKGDDPNKLGIYRPPLAIVKKFCKDTEFRKLWKIREKKVAKTKGDGTGKAAARKIGKKSDDDKEDQQQDMDVDMEDERHYDSNDNTISTSETDHDGSCQPSAEASDQRDVHDNASQPGDDEDSSDNESSESDSDSEDHDRRRIAKGKERADRNAEKKRQKKREAEMKRLEEEVAEAEKKKEEEEHKKMVGEIDAYAERKRSLKNGGKVISKKKTTEKVNVVGERKGVGRKDTKDAKDTKDVSEDEEGAEEEELEEIGAQEQDEEDKDEYEDR